MLLVFEEMRQLDHGKEVIRVCCVCHRMIDATQALAQLEACAKEGAGVEFSHGLCPRCYRLEMAKVNACTSITPSIRLLGSDGCAKNDRHRNCR